MPCYVSKDERGDHSDVYGSAYDFAMAHDATNGSFKMEIQNKLASL
jgi:hypothetical protein